MHGPVPQASPPQPQVSNSITSDGTPSVARSAASLLQPHSERGVEPTRSGRSAALPGCQGVRPTRERCFLSARAGCGATTNSRHAFWDISTLLAHTVLHECLGRCEQHLVTTCPTIPPAQYTRATTRFPVLYIAYVIVRRMFGYRCPGADVDMSAPAAARKRSRPRGLAQSHLSHSVSDRLLFYFC